MDVKQHWDELAQYFHVTDSTTDWLLGYPTVLKLLGDLNDKTVLDFGCRHGRFSRFAAQMFPLAHIIGVDTSRRAITRARNITEESLGIEYRHIGQYSEIREINFDCVCLNFICCTIPNSDTLLEIFKLNYEQLPEGGVLVLMDPHPESHGSQFTSFKSDPIVKQKSGDPVHVRLFTNTIDVEFDDYYWTRNDYESLLTKAGFRIVEVVEPVASQFHNSRIGDEKTVPPFIIFKGVKE